MVREQALTTHRRKQALGEARTQLIMMFPAGGLDVEKTYKPILAQALLPETAVERFDERILDRFARSDEVEIDLLEVCPGVGVSRRKIRAFVTRDRSRGTSLADRVVE